jgi:hypothetical protein
MATKITITVPDEYAEALKHVSLRELQFLFMDAVYEFKTHRGPTPLAYVRERYPGYTDEEVTKKAVQVRKRCEVAQALHHGQITQVEYNCKDEE